MYIVHLMSHTRLGRLELADPAVARRYWRYLRDGFPDTLAASIMTNHNHLITPTADPERARIRFARATGAIARGHGRGVWEPTIYADPIETPESLRSAVRYVITNPCESGYVCDPLEWIWSTHRDVVGAIADPWVDAGHLLDLMGMPDVCSPEQFHRWIMLSDRVPINPTPFPKFPAPGLAGQFTIREAAQAAASAYRIDVRRLFKHRSARALFVEICRVYGWDDIEQMTAALSISRRTIWRDRNSPPGESITAAGALYLGDPRLSHPQIEWPSRRPTKPDTGFGEKLQRVV